MIFNDIIFDPLQAVYVSRIMEGGPAEKDGKLKIGDRVISVSPSIDGHLS